MLCRPELTAGTPEMRLQIVGVAAVLVALVATEAPALGSANLVGDWRLDEGTGTAAADSSGHGNNGTITGSVAWTPGHVGAALGFDGNSGNVEVPRSSSLEPSHAVSVGAWVKHSGSPGAYRYILAKGAAGCIAASYGLYTGPSGGLEFYVSRDHGHVYARSPDAGGKVWDGKWHLAVGTFDGTTIRLYVDGVQVGSGTVYPGALEYPLASSNDLYIGDYPDCQTHTFVGDLDEVTVWSGALSAADVALLAKGDPTQSVPNGQPGSPAGTNGPGPGGARKVGSSKNGALLRRLRITPSRFLATVASSRRASGATISYVAARAGRTRLEILRAHRTMRWAKARRHRSSKRSASCTRYVLVGKFTHADRVGMNRLRFAGRPAGRPLAPGAYLLTARPMVQGQADKTLTLSFWILA
jgi:hypothetical protein